MVKDYLPTAKANEEVFRNILRDLKANRHQRPMGMYIPDNLDTEAPLEAMNEKLSTGNRNGLFTITDFTVEENRATIAFQDIAPLSGGGAGLLYHISGCQVEFQGQNFVMMS